MMNNQYSTKWVYYINQFLYAPLDALFTLMIFILSKETSASLFQIALFTSLRPIISLFAFYMNTILVENTHRIKKFIIILNFIGCAPVLLFPFVNNTWFYIASYFLFVLAVRCRASAWTEVLKKSLGPDSMCTVASKGFRITYVLTMAIPLLASTLMDNHPGIWKWLFFISAAFQLGSLAITSFLTVQKEPQQTKPIQSFMNLILFPWKSSWKLCRENTSFTKYLLLYLLGGVGIIAIQPVLPLFFNESLHISYQEIAIAISVCKGIGYLLTSSVWAKNLTSKSIYGINVYINIFTALYIVLLIASSWNTHLLYLAYIIYGITLAGCDLSWIMSGPIFSKNDETIMYSGVSLASIGIRGAIFPFLGQLIYQHSDAYTLFLIAGMLSIVSIFYGSYLHKQKSTTHTKVLVTSC